MLEQLNKLDHASALSPVMVEQLTGAGLAPVPEESNSFIRILRGAGGAWRQVELRLPPRGDGTAFVLVLQPALPPPLKDVTARFGPDFNPVMANPAAGAQGLESHVYSRPNGKLWFSYGPDETVRSIMIDRMGGPS